MKLYVARHGQTDWNVQRRAQGHSDIELNQTGIQQAEELRDKLKDYDFDICYSSPLKRAAKTAEIVCDGKCQIKYDERIIERCSGVFEGQVIDDWSKLANTDPALGVEQRPELLARSKSFLDDLKAEYQGTDAQILIVAHNGILKNLHFNIVGYDENTDFSEVQFGNGEVKEYEL